MVRSAVAIALAMQASIAGNGLAVPLSEAPSRKDGCCNQQNPLTAFIHNHTE
jgi:hypothetical protein